MSWIKRQPLLVVVLPFLFVFSTACLCSPNLLEPTSAPPAAPEARSTELNAPATNLPPVQAGQPVGSTTAELMRATVQVWTMNLEGDSFSATGWGSGSIVSPNGLVLTNAHVIDDVYGPYTHIGIAITLASDREPIVSYLAEIAAVNWLEDLAVLRIVADTDGNPLTPELPYIKLGNSDTLEIGDPLRILGYPSIGGETITFTEGVVSGFSSERGVEGRAWIKTDTTIAGGNSGGMGANLAGELIGIPTIASSSADAETVDCRLIADTNGDGVIDGLDSCVPIGGFLNGLRPVNLALPLINAALTEQPYVIGGEQPRAPSGGFDTTHSSFFNLEFADAVTEDDQPVQLYWALPGDATQICAFWDYEGMADGMRWSAFWYVGGELSDGGSYIDETWNGGESGNWWVCITNSNGLTNGLYELALEVEGEMLVNDSIFVGGNRQLGSFSIRNQSSYEVCYALLSPSEAQNWGQLDLGPADSIASGRSGSLSLVSGTYDMLLLDCDADTLLEEYAITVDGDFEYTITD